MTRVIEIVGLFAAITSFTIGAISLSKGDCNIPPICTGGLIVILMGALMLVSSCFHMLLHNKAWKDIRQILVISAAMIFIGFGVCVFFQCK